MAEMKVGASGGWVGEGGAGRGRRWPEKIPRGGENLLRG